MNIIAILSAILTSISVLISITIFIIGIRDREILGGTMIALLCFWFAYIISIPSIITEIKVIDVQYIQPTNIIKTNNTTHMYIIYNNTSYSTKSTEASYYNSTNIMLRKKISKNIWGIKTRSYNFVSQTNNNE